MANFTLVLAGLFVPVGGILLAHFVLRREDRSVTALYRGPGGEPAPIGRWSRAGMSAWIVGSAVFYLAQPVGGVAPALVASIAVYLGLSSSRAAFG
jgi:purine-cytosine permease-like protein